MNLSHDPRALLCGPDCKLEILWLDPRRYISYTSTGSEAVIVPVSYATDTRMKSYAFQFGKGTYWNDSLSIPTGLDFERGVVDYQTTFLLSTQPEGVEVIKLKFSFYHLYEGVALGSLAPVATFSIDLPVVPAMAAYTFFAGKMANALDLKAFQANHNSTDRMGVLIERLSTEDTYSGNLLLMDARVYCFHTGEVGLTI